MEQVIPYKDSAKSKKEQVSEMFDDISPRYDFLNHTLSMGIDKSWRRKLRKIIAPAHPAVILDIATGTGDLAIELAKLKPQKITGIDISEGMMKIGREKIKDIGLANLISLESGDAENLKYNDGSFDAVTAAFGVRNFENVEKGLNEIYRVLKPGGIVAILEFSHPQKFPFKQLYLFYFNFVLPMAGRLVSKNNAAYTYLPQSVSSFPSGKEFTDKMGAAGFKNTTWKELTFGICTVYTGKK